MDVLANWAWQGCAVALAATVILRASRRMSATTRYHLWWVTLLVVLVLPAFSLQIPASVLSRDAFRTQPGDAALTALPLSWKPGAGSVVLPTLPVWILSLLTLVWFVWVTVSLSRTLGAIVTLRRAKRTARPFPAARESRLETWLILRARGRRTALGVSDRVRAAAVLGLTSPSIVVAPGALGALTDRELDQIVVHEWAHVQRRDDLARLVQRIVVAIAGLHPAIWWIDRQLNLERETACDDWAVDATGSAKGLAVCLTKLAALPGRPADAVLLPAALLSSELTTRVVRLLDRNRNTSTTRTLGAPMLVAPVLGALALIVAGVELVVTSPLAPDQPRAAVSAATVVAALAKSGGSDPGAISPSAVLGIRDALVRPPEGARRTSRPPVRTSGPATARRLLSASAAADAPDVGVIAAQQDSPRREGVVQMDRPVVQGPFGDNLPGVRTPAAAVIPAETVTPGAPAGARGVESATPWGVAADAGVTVGKGSQKAAVATAGFFTRLSKSISGVF